MSHTGFSCCYPAQEIKRESGENPGQARCCKLHTIVPDQFSCHCLKHDGKASGDGSKSEDLPVQAIVRTSRIKGGICTIYNNCTVKTPENGDGCVEVLYHVAI